MWCSASRDDAQEKLVRCIGGGRVLFLCPAPRHASASPSTMSPALTSQRENPTGEINKRRSALLVPGDALTPTAADARVPILLVQQAGAKGGCGCVCG